MAQTKIILPVRLSLPHSLPLRLITITEVTPGPWGGKREESTKKPPFDLI